MVKDPTRKNILDYLHTHHTGGSAEIARTLNLSGAAVRYHLGLLKQEGKVELAPDLGARTPGRPVKHYRLVAEARPNHLAGLASLLLSARLAESGPDNETKVWTAMARDIEGLPTEKRPLPRRLAQTIQRLNQMNYQARWEAGPLGPRIFMANCPYAAIWKQFPGLCVMDLYLLERLTGLRLRQSFACNSYSSFCFAKGVT